MDRPGVCIVGKWGKKKARPWPTRGISRGSSRFGPGSPFASLGLAVIDGNACVADRPR